MTGPSHEYEKSIKLAVMFSPLKHCSHLLHLLSSYVSYHKHENENGHSCETILSIITDGLVQNCVNSICTSRQLEYVGDASQMCRGPTGKDHDIWCQLQPTTTSISGENQVFMTMLFQSYRHIELWGAF